MAETIDIAIKVALKEFEASMAGMEGVSKNAAKKVTKAIASGLRKADRAAAKSGDEIRESLGEGLEAAKQAAEGFGGAIGGTAGQVEKFTRASVLMGKSFGPIGLGIVAAGTALTGFGLAAGVGIGALVSITDEAEAALVALEPFADALGIPPENIATLREADQAIDAVKTAASALSLTLAGEFAPGVKDAAVQLGALTLAASDAVDSLADSRVANFAKDWYTFFTSVEDGIGEYNVFAGAVRKVGAAVEYQVPKMLELVEIHGELNEEAREGAGRQKSLADALKEAADAAKEVNDVYRDSSALMDSLAAANEGLADVLDEANSDELSDTDKINQAYDERIAKIRELGKASSDAAGMTEALAAAEERRVRDLDAHWSSFSDGQVERLAGMEESLEEMQGGWVEYLAESLSSAADSVLIVTDTITEAITGFADIRIEKLQEQAAQQQQQAEREWARNEEGFRRANDLALERGQISKAGHAQQLKLIDSLSKAERKRIRRMARDEKRQAMKAFKRSQKAAIGQSIINGGVAALALIPAFSILGPGAPLAAAGVAGAGVALQIAKIKAQEPPSFADGGHVGSVMARMAPTRRHPDHVDISASREEFVVSPRGVAAVGREALDAISQGRQSFSSNTTVIVDGRVIHNLVDDYLNKAVRVTPGLAAGQQHAYGTG